MRRHAQAAGALFGEVAARLGGGQGGRFMGLEVRALQQPATQAAAMPPVEPAASSAPQAVFAFALQPA